ncbi:hypothetical protein GYA49_05740 [Candidatus Beckwithbacteria bacterium]|nr:hypothetical protein [Candidatus Beckwithbacteria bacterium]
MRYLLGFPLSFVFSSLLISFCLLLPFPFVFTKSSVKQTLHEVNFYNRIILIIKDKSISDFTNQDSLFGNLISANIDAIFPKDWVENLGDNLIDHSFNSLTGQTKFSDFTIDLHSIKQNFLDLIAQSDIKEDENTIKASIPNQITLSDVLQIDATQLDDTFALLQAAINAFFLALLVLVILLAVEVGVFFIIFPKKQALLWLAINIGFTGLVSISSMFVFHFLLLKPENLQAITQNQSLWKILQYIVALSFLEKLTRLWSFLGLLLVVLALAISLYNVLKSKL